MDRWFAVTAFFDADTEHFKSWYVDFERPPTRTKLGIDTRDLFLDAVVKPDLSIIWKDEGEYDQAVALGLLTSEDRERVAEARQEVLRLVADGALLRGAWGSWRRNRRWPVPVLPPEILRDISSVVPSA